MKKLKKSLKKTLVKEVKAKTLKSVGDKKMVRAVPGANYELFDLSITGPGMPKISKYITPGTFRKKYSDGKSNSFTTVMPNGLHVGWDTCGKCLEWVGVCRCPEGVMCPRSVEYIYDHITAELAGEEWTYNHPRYKVGSVHAMRYGQANNDNKRLSMPKTSSGSGERKLLTKPFKSEPLPEEAFDGAKLRKVAEGLAKDAEVDVNRKLKKLEGAGGTKTLGRKTKLRKR